MLLASKIDLAADLNGAANVRLQGNVLPVPGLIPPIPTLGIVRCSHPVLDLETMIPALNQERSIGNTVVAIVAHW
jgi:hypothetical protein